MDAAESGSDEFVGTDGSSVGEMAATEDGSDIAAIEIDSGEPETVFTDDFNRDDEDLEDRTDFWTRQPSVGTSTSVAGAAGISGNRLRIVDGSSSTLYTSPDCGSEDHYVQFDTAQVTLDASAFHVCRAIDTENFIGIRCLKIGSTQFREVYSRENSNLSLEFSESTTLTVGDTFRLECDGDRWTAFHNDTQFATGNIPAFLTGVGATLTGICARGGPLDPWADNYESGMLAAEGNSTGTLAAAETGADTASITGSAPSSGTMDADESGSDTFSSVEPSTGSLATTESGSDTVAFTGTAPSSARWRRRNRGRHLRRIGNRAELRLPGGHRSRR